jgi:hypothetical protein
MSTNVPYHLSNYKLHTMSTISPNLLQTACNVYNHPQPTTVCIQYLQSSPTNNRLHTIATIILNQQQTACNVHNLPQPTTDNIQCPQSSPTKYRLHIMSTIYHNQLQMAYNVKTPRFPRSRDRMQCQQPPPPKSQSLFPNFPNHFLNYRWNTIT